MLSDSGNLREVLMRRACVHEASYPLALQIVP